MEQQFDILVALSVSTIYILPPLSEADFPDPRYNSASSFHPTIIEMNWCAYDLKRQIVIDEVQHYVKPLDFAGNLPEETTLRTNIRSEQLFSALSLFEVIQKFNDFLYLTFVRNNLSFCLVTLGDDLLCRVLPIEARETKIKLAYHYQQYFDIKEEFIKFSSNTNITSLKDMLTYLGLKEVPAETVCQNNCKTLVRIINMLTRSNHYFISPKIVETQIKSLMKNFNAINSSQNNNYPPQTQSPPPSGQRMGERKRYPPSSNSSNYVKYRSPESYGNPNSKYFLRLRGLPYSAKEPDVLGFFRGIHLNMEDIQLHYNVDGRFSGDCFVKLHSDADFREALTYNMSGMGSRYIEIFESSNVEFEKARSSQYPPSSAVSSFSSEDVGILKMRGLPYSSTEEDILFFFRDFKLARNGVKRAVTAGRPSGEAYVVFDSREEALRALNLNMEKIGTRFIELFSVTSRELDSYLQANFVPSTASTVAQEATSSASIPPERKKSTLMACGLPYTVTKESILEFFHDFRLIEKDIYFIDNQAGRFSGNVLVTFEEEGEMQRALRTKNLAYLGNRYVELYEYR